LQKFASTSPPITTHILDQASHVVLNPFSKFGEAFLRTRPSPPPLPSSSSSSTSPRSQSIVALRWIEDCIGTESWQPEESYLYIPVSLVEEKQPEEEVPIQTVGRKVVELEPEATVVHATKEPPKATERVVATPSAPKGIPVVVISDSEDERDELEEEDVVVEDEFNFE